jgi:molybdate transport system permease protein
MDSFPHNKITSFHHRIGAIPLWGMSLPAILFLGGPLLILLGKISPAEAMTNLAKPQVTQAISLSFTTTLITTGLVALFGTPLAYLLARRHFVGRIVLESIVDLVMVLPPAVAGIALLITFGRTGLVGSWLNQYGITIPFTSLAVIMAQTFVAAPFYIRTATAALVSIHRDIEEAAAIDGATRPQIFWHITVPMVLPSLFAGLIMSWARALGEFGATIIFAGNFSGRTQTIPLVIYLGFEIDVQEALVLSSLLLLVAFTILMTVRYLIRQQTPLIYENSKWE